MVSLEDGSRTKHLCLVLDCFMSKGSFPLYFSNSSWSKRQGAKSVSSRLVFKTKRCRSTVTFLLRGAETSCVCLYLERVPPLYIQQQSLGMWLRLGTSLVTWLLFLFFHPWSLSFAGFFFLVEMLTFFTGIYRIFKNLLSGKFRSLQVYLLLFRHRSHCSI